MTALPGLADLLADPLLEAVLAGRRDGLLLLDYDGTLAPFSPDRARAVPYAGLVEILARFPRTGPGRCVVVSGREIAEIETFLGPGAPAEIWGCHGATHRLPDGTEETLALTSGQQAALDKAALLLPTGTPDGALERKSVSVALHWRGLPADAADRLGRQVEPLWRALAKTAGLSLHAFDGGLELRVPGWDKGRPVRALRREYPEAVLIYCGDDRTDEDAFAALGSAGLGVLVRPSWRPTAARYHLTPPEQLLAFLRAWAVVGEG